MGATWILQNRYTTVLFPNFEFKEVKGAINPRKIGLKPDSDPSEVKEKPGQLKNVLSQDFGLAHIPDIRWERKRDAFIAAITQLNTNSLIISNEAQKLLQAACEANDGTIIKTADLSETYIGTNGQNFIVSQERREVVKWESALDELLNVGFVREKGLNGEIFVASKAGYDYIEQFK